MTTTGQGAAPASRHVADDLFEVAGEEVALVGSRCDTCSSHYFPQALGCRNPDCDGTSVVRALLGRRGRLHSYTVQHYRPPPLFRMAPWAPYAIGLVELDEGLQVIGMLTGPELGALEIGAPVRLVAEQLYQDEGGTAVLTYKYALDEGRRTA